jgi:hypothetical protein
MPRCKIYETVIFIRVTVSLKDRLGFTESQTQENYIEQKVQK